MLPADKTQYNTLGLDKSTWDLELTPSGELSLGTGSYGLAQDASSACLVFSGECYFDNTLGIPWKTDILGKSPSAGFISTKLSLEVKKLPAVQNATAWVQRDNHTRTVKGQITITDIHDNTIEVQM